MTIDALDAPVASRSRVVLVDPHARSGRRARHRRGRGPGVPPRPRRGCPAASSASTCSSPSRASSSPRCCWPSSTRTGGLRFGRFYLRRARRLLPALFLVLVATVAAGDHRRAGRRRSGCARTPSPAFFYVTNWWYVLHGTSYFEATGRPPMLQHLWSLAVEEQFYFVWPLLLYGLWRLGASRGVQVGADRGRAALHGASWRWISVRDGHARTSTDPSRVYFGTDTHAMTLLVGAALATFWRPGASTRALTSRGPTRGHGRVGSRGLLALVADLLVRRPDVVDALPRRLPRRRPRDRHGRRRRRR